jgi:hypothetical protein
LPFKCNLPRYSEEGAAKPKAKRAKGELTFDFENPGWGSAS